MDSAPHPENNESTPLLVTARQRWDETYQKWRPFLPALAFVGGLSLDAISLDRFDQVFPLVQQGLYLLVLAAMVFLELVAESRPIPMPARVQKLETYFEDISHFLYGSLLSAYTVFYFKSASVWASFLFFTLICGLLLANEFAGFRRAGFVLRVSLLSLCMVSYLCYLVPVILGWIGVVPFLIAVAVALVVLGCVAWAADRWLQEGEQAEERRAMLKLRFWRPVGVVIGVFVGLYFLRVIPPVPLALKDFGIYHEVKINPTGRKVPEEFIVNGKKRYYLLLHQKPWWKFWESGDQSFHARPGDKVYSFFSVIAPVRFREQLQVRWFYDDPKEGWRSSDAIPIRIEGGRELGYRGFSFKRNFVPGKWQVRIETSDNREVGRLSVDIIADTSQEKRQFEEIWK